jgi:hypothetical protein
MSNVHQLQHRLEQSHAVKAARRPAEQQHWDTLVARVDEPGVARLIVRFLDQAPSEKLKQPGLYLRASLVLRDEFARTETQARQARQARANNALKFLISAGYFIYRSIRLPFRAARDLKTIILPHRLSGRPLFR